MTVMPGTSSICEFDLPVAHCILGLGRVARGGALKLFQVCCSYRFPLFTSSCCSQTRQAKVQGQLARYASGDFTGQALLDPKQLTQQALALATD